MSDLLKTNFDRAPPVQATSQTVTLLDFGEEDAESALAFGLFIHSQQLGVGPESGMPQPNGLVVNAFRAKAREMLGAYLRANLDEETSKRISEAEVRAADEMKKAGLSAIPARVDEVVRINFEAFVLPLHKKIDTSGSFMRQVFLALLSSLFISVLTLLLAYLIYISPINLFPEKS